MTENRNSEQFYYPISNDKHDWSQYTLIMPVVAVGNVGQLAVDILVATLLEKNLCKFVGRIVSDAVVPVCGPNAYNLFTKEVMTTCQLYESSEHKLVILQQRAPCFRERRQKFIKQLTSWLKTNNFKQVVILSSSFSQFLASSLRSHERQPLRFLCTSAFDQQTVDRITYELCFKPVEKVDRETLVPRDDGVVYLPGSGITKMFYESWQHYDIMLTCDQKNLLLDYYEMQGIKALLLLLYCSEGDNTLDAFAFVKYLNEYVGIANASEDQFWQAPISWRDLFGGRIPDGLY